MQTPEELLRGWGLTDRPAEFDGDIHSWRCSHPDRYGACTCFQEIAQELAARDAEIRADERGRCSVVHATLTDEALVAELVRRGVLEVECETRDSDRPTDCWEHGAAKDLCEPRCTFKWYPPVRVKRHVSPWQPVADEGGAS